MPCMKRRPALTARSVLDFIQAIRSKVANKEEVLFSSYSEQLKQTHSIPEDSMLIKQKTSNELTFKTDWKHLNTRIFGAEMAICHKFQLMQTILTYKDRQETSSEVQRLQNGILDSNNGVPSNLSVIHQLLVGQTVTNPFEKGLLEMWSEGIYANMGSNLMSATIHQAYIDTYLDNSAILQFKGILLLTEANTNSHLFSLQLDLFENNLNEQINKKEKTVPTHMTYLINPNGKKGFFLRPVFDDIDEPFVIFRGSRKKLGYDYMCGYTEEGKWFFKESPTFDEDGSLLISGSSRDGEIYYMSVSEENIVQCVAEENLATPFDVIPLEFLDNKVKISVRKSTSKPDAEHYLGHHLRFIEGQDNIDFSLSFDRGCL